MKNNIIREITVFGWVIISIGVLLVVVGLSVEGSVSTKIIGSLIILAVAFGCALLISKIHHAMQKRRKSKTMESTTEPHFDISNELIDDIICAFERDEGYEAVDGKIGGLSEESKKKAIFCALERIVDNYQERGEVSDSDENRFCNLTEHFKIQHTELDNQPFYQEFVKLLVINDLLKGVMPTRVKIPPESVLINLQKDEHVLWAFDNVKLYELTKKVTRVGSASGWSGRILKGLYYRKSSFRGETIVTQNMEYIATGLAYITDKNLYFNAAERGMRIPYSKIVSYIPYEDGIGVLRDGIMAKPICLKGIDGWFAYNFVKNINNIKSE
ncbi:MAG: hypothetical protein J5848_06945 [Bacteroidales bacterium]|nr:hypothetical protein [Bacteroidales bacterium]